MLEERMPVLKYLIWRPVWAEKECDMLPGGDFDDMVQNYRENMFDLHRELRVFAYVLPGDRYLCFERGVEKSRHRRLEAEPEHLWKAMKEGDSGLVL